MAGDLLLRTTPWGLNLPLWLAQAAPLVLVFGCLFILVAAVAVGSQSSSPHRLKH